MIRQTRFSKISKQNDITWCFPNHKIDCGWIRCRVRRCNWPPTLDRSERAELYGSLGCLVMIGQVTVVLRSDWLPVRLYCLCARFPSPVIASILLIELLSSLFM